MDFLISFKGKKEKGRVEVAAVVRVVTAAEAVALRAGSAITAATRIMMMVNGKRMMAVIVVEGVTWGKQEKGKGSAYLPLLSPHAGRSFAKVGTCKTPPP